MQRILKMTGTYFLSVTVFAAAFVFSGIARADALASIDKAYETYRTASSYLRTENTGLALLDLSATVSTWREVQSASAPAPLANDPKYADAINEIATLLQKGLSEAEAGDPKAARAAIMPVRDILFDLRRRNGMNTYADCITELNTAMDAVFAYRRPEPDMSDSKVISGMRDASKAYEQTLQKCRDLAPASISSDPEFIRLFDGTKNSVESMYPAIDSGSANAVINVIRELISFDRIIFFRFGG
jgi:hypothetical protein